MKMKKSIIFLIAVLIFALVSGTGAAKEITVNSTDSIQAAVNSAASGDVIIVKPGIYTENVQITTPNLVIKSESGPENTIIKINSTTGFTVIASNTTISGFKVEFGNSGIYLARCSSCTITDNDLSDNRYGISLINSNNNTISRNQANSNKMFGIHLDSSEGNTLLNNIVNSNTRGINSITSNKNKILDNIALNNSQYGMWISQSNDNNISGNTVKECGNGEAGSGGIHQNSSSRNIISGNIIAFNKGYSLFECPACHNNHVYNNYINNERNANIKTKDTTWNIEKTAGTNIVGGSYIGGNFWGTPEGTGFSQTAADKDEDKDGIIDLAYIDSSNSIIDNLPLAPVSNPQSPILPVANFSANVIIGYAPLVVQFTDYSQNVVSRSWDINNDGIVDSTNESFVYVYQNPGIYTANLTVTNENGTNSTTIQIMVEGFQVQPIADFNANPMSGNAPLSVQFTDLSQNATSRNWNFGDGATSTDPNPSHTYNTAGTYTATLTATSENSTSLKGISITVTEQSSSSDSSSSGSSSSGSSHHSSSSNNGGGGGAGSSPEPQSNVQVKELSQGYVTNGKPVEFDFTKNATCVVYASFDAKKTAGKTTAIAEQLKGKSTLVSVLNSTEIYKYFNVWVGTGGFATSKNIENPVVCFKVEKSWIQDKKIDQNSITLYRYSDKKWSQIPTKLLKEDNKYLYFTAQTPEFSFFAITGKAVEKQKVAETKYSTNTSGIKQNNTTVVKTEPTSKTEQKSDNGNSTSTPGFGAVSFVVCLIIVFLHKRK
jgi:PGF-pre-PGF domain-containing protein